MLNGEQTVETIHAMFEKHYAGEQFVKVMPLGAEADTNGFIGANNRSGWDGLELFVTGNEELDAKFVKEAKEAGFENLKGHRTVGGMRASIYNAMPIEGVEALVKFMDKFEKENA